MAIGTTAAILGSAVIGAGASMAGAKSAAGAAKDASRENAAVQREVFQQTRTDLAPGRVAYAPAVDALMQRFGLAPTSTAPAGSQGAVMAGTTLAQPNTGNTAASGYGALGAAGVGLAQQQPASASAVGAGRNLVMGADGQPSYVANTSSGATSAQGDQILADRPDVASNAWLASVDPSVIGDRTGDGQVTPQDRAIYWQQNYGAQDGYQMPAAPQTPTQPGANQPSTIPGQTFDSANNGGLGPRPVTSRPQFGEQQPNFSTPGGPDFSASAFESSPYYQLGLADDLRNVNARFGARGLLKSGAALQGFQESSANNFRKNYGQWAGQEMAKWQTNLGQFNTDRAAGLGQFNLNRNVFNTNYDQDTSRSDNIFDSDRAYNTNRYDAYTGNLFNLANMGQSAAGQTANAGQNYAANATANNNALASVKGNAAIAMGNSVNNLVNTGLQAYGMSQNPFASGGGGGGFRVSPAGGWF